MNPFELTLSATAAHLVLPATLTIEHAAALQAALVPALTAARALTVDATTLRRTDAAVLQLLWAAARTASHAVVVAPGPGWTAAWVRHGLTDPFQRS